MDAVDQRRRALSLLSMALVLVLACVGCTLSTIVAARTLATQHKYGLARTIAPGIARIVAQDSEAVLGSDGGHGAALARLRQAVGREPLDAFAIAALGEAEAAAGNKQRTVALMRLALQVDPRNAKARAWLVQDDIEHRRFSSAVFGFDRLILLLPEARSQVLAGLASLAQLPETEAAFARVLAARPHWRPNLFESLNKANAPAEIVWRYRNYIEGPELPSAIDLLLRNNDIAAARALRTKVLDAAARGHGVVDPGLTGRIGVPPFGWSQTTVASGAVTFSDSGATIFAEPGAVIEASSQRLLLAPGRYVLSIRGGLVGSSSGATSLASSASVRARLTCDGGADLGVVNVDGPPGVRRAAFAVGNDGSCGSQRLSLLADPSGSLRPLEATVQTVDITRQ